MNLFVVGLDYKTAPVRIREKLAFEDEACSVALKQLVDGEIVSEAMILSTCNRVEIVVASDFEQDAVIEQVRNFLSETHSVEQETFDKYLYTLSDMEAARHVFRVASSLESMVIGEAQILGQMRNAYSLAVVAGTTGRVLHRLAHHAFHVAKRVRTETDINALPVSISHVAVELGRKIFDSLNDKTVLLIGAGKMSEIALQYLAKSGVTKILVSNRTKETAQKLAERFGGNVVDWSELDFYLPEADITICSTGAPNYVLTPEMIHAAQKKRGNSPMCVIDISVPRNVDPKVCEVKNTFVFNIDDLEKVVESNLRERKRDAERAEKIIEAELLRFQDALTDLDVGQTVSALRQKIEEIAFSELNRHRNKLADITPEQEQVLKAMLTSTINKICHPIIQQLRNTYRNGDTEIMQVWRQTFGIETK